jgi:hypothetical protein
MTVVCRIPLQNGTAPLPSLECTVENGCMVVRAPPELTILDTDDLCQYTGCRMKVSTGKSGQRLTYCAKHSEYSRRMQKENYARQKLRNMSGLCARRDCNKPRSENKHKPGSLGRLCADHANELNQRSKHAYHRHKHKRQKTRE